MRTPGSFLAASLLLVACGGSGEGTPDWPKGNVVLHDANNYASQSTLTIPTVATAPGADLTVCWDGITKDVLCHDLAPPDHDIDNISFLQIPNMSHEMVAAKLAAGQLDEHLVSLYRDYYVSKTPTSTCAQLSQFMLGAERLVPATDYVEAPGKSYMLLFATGTTPGVGARSMMFLEPTAGTATTMVAAPDGCSSDILDFNATLGEPIGIPAADPTQWLVDWSQITHDSFGNPISFSGLKRVLVGFYQGKTVADIEAGFRDSEVSATSQYEVAVPAGARDVNLADATLRGAATPFPGFARTDGLWLVAVMCDQCQLPAPVVLSVLQPQ